MVNKQVNYNKGLFKKQISVSELVSLSLLSLVSMCYVLNASLLNLVSLGTPLKILILGIEIIFMMMILIGFMRKSLNNTLMKVCILLLLLLSFLNSGQNTILVTFLIVLTFYNYDFENLVLFLMVGQMIGVLLVLAAMNFGVISNLATVRLGVVRYSLGFLNPNTISNYLLAILLKYLYLRRNNIRILELIIINIPFFIIVNLTNSRTSIYLLLIFDLMLIISKYIITNKSLLIKWLFSANVLALFGSIVVSFVMAIFYNQQSSIWNTLDTLLTNRVSSANTFWKTYGISLLGQQVELRNTFEAAQGNLSALILDNGILQLAIIYGLVIMVVVILFYWLSIRRMFSNRDSLMLMISIIYIIYGLNSGIVFSWEYNLSLFYLGSKFNYGEFVYENRDFNLPII